MDNNYLPDRQRPGQLAERGPSGLVPHAGSAPVHAPGEMPIQPMTMTMDDLWARLDPKVRARIMERAGRIHTRFAYEQDPGRIAAVVLGDGGLVVAQPTVNASGGQATALTQLRAEPGTVRSVQVDADTSVERHAARSTGPAPRTAPPLPLPDDFLAFLGNLPARAQQLLQDPFIGAYADLRCEHYYTTSSYGQGIGANTMQTWCYITDRRTVTFAWGSAFAPGGSFAAARWRQTCVRFTVAGRS